MTLDITGIHNCEVGRVREVRFKESELVSRLDNRSSLAIYLRNRVFIRLAKISIAAWSSAIAAPIVGGPTSYTTGWLVVEAEVSRIVLGIVKLPFIVGLWHNIVPLWGGRVK